MKPYILCQKALKLTTALALAAGVFTDGASAQSLTYKTSWIGNTFGPGQYAKHVGTNMQYLWVKPDGTCYTGANWEEGSFEGGIYKAGNQIGNLADAHFDFRGSKSVTGDDRYIYAARKETIRRYNFSGSHAPFTGALPDGSNPNRGRGGGTIAPTDTVSVSYLATGQTNRRLFAVIGSEVWVYNTTSGIVYVSKWAMTRPGPCTVATDGTLWIVQNADTSTTPVTAARLLHYNADGTAAAGSLTLPVDVRPVSLAFNPSTGRLMLGDGGINQNVKIYDIANLGTAPTLFGVTGGIFSGTVGQVGEKRFVGVTGAGADSLGNLYVAQNRFGQDTSGYATGGGILESYPATGARLWRLLGLEFIDCADVDKPTISGDNMDVYTKLSRYRLNLANTAPGSEWTWLGHTLNQWKYPTDPRYTGRNENSAIDAGVWMRTLQGKKIMFMTDMVSRSLEVFRFNSSTDGETAIPCGPAPKNTSGDLVSFPWVDSSGGMWRAEGKNIHYWPFTGLDASGVPQWGAKVSEAKPADMRDVMRVEYQAATDTMYVAGWASDIDPTHYYQGTAWNAKAIGSVIARYNNWSTVNRTTAWRKVVPYGGPNNDNKEAVPIAMSVEGEYIFLGYTYFGQPDGGRIDVYRLSDASFVGSLRPGPEVENRTASLDAVFGVRAYRRSNGEYLVWLEGDWFSKVLMYRWQPNLVPTADTYAYDASPGTNYGTATGLAVKGAPAGYNRTSYLKFDVTNLPATVSSAKLRLRVQSVGTEGPAPRTVQVMQIADASDGWTETGLTWSNRPAAGAQITTFSGDPAGAIIEVDVTSYVNANITGNNICSFVLQQSSTGNRLVTFDSREGGTPPQLVIVP